MEEESKKPVMINEELHKRLKRHAYSNSTYVFALAEKLIKEGLDKLEEQNGCILQKEKHVET